MGWAFRCGRHFPPRLSRQLQWIHRVGNDVQSEPQIIGRHAVSGNISFRTFHARAAIAQRLFDGIYSQVNGTQPAAQIARQFRFPGARKPTKNKQYAS